MKQIYYVIQALIHGRGANIIKVVSLGLGLTMSILLFSRVVYEQSFDTCFKDHDKLYQLWNIWTVNGEPFPPSEFIIGAAAGGILDAMPEIVESAASTGSWPVSAPIYNGSVRFDDFKVAADSLFFQTMGIEVLSGDPVRELQQKDVIFLSKDLADKMFGGENPIGKIISFNKEIELTVKGTYAALPENCTMRPKAVISLPSIWSRRIGNYSWNGGDSWKEYIRLKQDIDLDELKKRISGHAGLAAHLGTTDIPAIIKSIEGGDTKAELVLNAMIYQVAKSVGAAAVVLYGKVDAILLTGGIAHSEYVISRLKERVSFLAPVHVYPGEDELEALAVNVLGALRGELPIQVYK